MVETIGPRIALYSTMDAVREQLWTVIEEDKPGFMTSAEIRSYKLSTRLPIDKRRISVDIDGTFLASKQTKDGQLIEAFPILSTIYCMQELKKRGYDLVAYSTGPAERMQMLWHWDWMQPYLALFSEVFTRESLYHSAAPFSTQVHEEIMSARERVLQEREQGIGFAPLWREASLDGLEEEDMRMVVDILPQRPKIPALIRSKHGSPFAHLDNGNRIIQSQGDPLRIIHPQDIPLGVSDLQKFLHEHKFRPPVSECKPLEPNATIYSSN